MNKKARTLLSLSLRASSPVLFLTKIKNVEQRKNEKKRQRQVAYERLLNVQRRVWILPLRFAYKVRRER